MNQFEIEVINALRELELPCNLMGYEYIKSAMNHLHENPNDLYRITSVLYPTVAEKHGTTPSRTERGIRHAISQSRADDPTWYRVMGRVGPMSNSEFLASLNEAIKLKMAIQAPAVKSKAVKA